MKNLSHTSEQEQGPTMVTRCRLPSKTYHDTWTVNIPGGEAPLRASFGGRLLLRGYLEPPGIRAFQGGASKTGLELEVAIANQTPSYGRKCCRLPFHRRVPSMAKHVRCTRSHVGKCVSKELLIVLFCSVLV